MSADTCSTCGEPCDHEPVIHVDHFGHWPTEIIDGEHQPVATETGETP